MAHTTHCSLFERTHSVMKTSEARLHMGAETRFLDGKDSDYIIKFHECDNVSD